MMASTGKRNAVLTILGGILTTGILGLDDIAPHLVGFASIVPILLAFGVLEIYRRFDDHYGRAGRAGVMLTGVGLASLFLGVLLYAFIPPSLVALFIVAIPGSIGLLTLGLGSIYLAYSLSRIGILGLAQALALGLGIPLIPVIGGLVAFVVGRSPMLDELIPAGVGTGFSGILYGLGWIAVGFRLWTGVWDDEPIPEEQADPIEFSPQLATGGLVAGTFLLLGLGRFVPLGPLSGTPWVDQSLALDTAHLLAGLIGVGLVGLRNERLVGMYNELLGLFALSIAALGMVGIFQDIAVLQEFIVGQLGLDLPDVVLYLPIGIVLSVVGFLVDS